MALHAHPQAELGRQPQPKAGRLLSRHRRPRRMDREPGATSCLFENGQKGPTDARRFEQVLEFNERLDSHRPTCPLPQTRLPFVSFQAEKPRTFKLKISAASKAEPARGRWATSESHGLSRVRVDVALVVRRRDPVHRRSELQSRATSLPPRLATAKQSTSSRLRSANGPTPGLTRTPITELRSCPSGCTDTTGIARTGRTRRKGQRASAALLDPARALPAVRPCRRPALPSPPASPLPLSAPLLRRATPLTQGARAIRVLASSGYFLDRGRRHGGAPETRARRASVSRARRLTRQGSRVAVIDWLDGCRHRPRARIACGGGVWQAHQSR